MHFRSCVIVICMHEDALAEFARLARGTEVELRWVTCNSLINIEAIGSTLASPQKVPRISNDRICWRRSL